jgi:dCMP deaminase
MRWVADYMLIARIIAKRSTCNRGKVGSVLARDRRIISTGYNGAPSGMPHCSHDIDEDVPCLDAVHSEVNALAFAAKYGVSTDNTVLIVTKAPCAFCAQLLINAGVKEVYFEEEYRNEKGLEILYGAGVSLHRVEESKVPTVLSIQDYIPSMYRREPAVPQNKPPYDDRGGVAGVEGGADWPSFLGAGGGTAVGGTVSLRPKQGTLFGDERGEVPPG